FSSKDFSNALRISRVSFAPAELMLEMLGTKIGAATVFGTLLDSAKDVRLVIDRDILNEEFYGCSDSQTTGYMKVKTSDIFEKLLPSINKKFDTVEL
ncbi:MAG: YbaK/EbsC family protein, partial [Clostridia bacterium]|nr:YbaK/EbsC family protein [Clostridia bacterium]